jgi:hypothetical protein
MPGGVGCQETSCYKIGFTDRAEALTSVTKAAAIER